MPLEVFRTFALALHLLCVNVASAGPLVCLWLEWRESGGDRTAGRARRRLATASLLLLLAGAVLGLLLGAASWSEGYAAAVARLAPRVFWGVWEFVFSLLLMTWYAVWSSPDARAWQRVARSLLAVLAATNLLYHFPFLFLLLSPAGDPSASADAIDSAAFRRLIVQGLVLSRATHFLLSALAVSGVALMGIAMKLGQQATEAPAATRLAVGGGRLALGSTLLQIPVGLWILTQLPPTVQNRLLGGDAWATLLLLTALVLVLVLLHQLAAVALGDARSGRLRAAAIVTFLVVLLMSGVSRYL